MADDKSKVGGQDRQAHQLQRGLRGSQSLGVTEEELRKTVAAVGDRADKVREHLGKK